MKWQNLISNNHYSNIELKKDLQGKNRFIKAIGVEVKILKRELKSCVLYYTTTMWSIMYIAVH